MPSTGNLFQDIFVFHTVRSDGKYGWFLHIYGSGIVLSIGAPGIPGAGLVCLSVLLTQIGVPAEALSLVMGIDSLLGMFRTAVNSAGDVAVSLIVAKSEKLLDVEKYNS